MRLASIRVGADPDRWRELGFEVRPGDRVPLGNGCLELDGAATRGSIASWALEGAEVPGSIDGLSTRAGARPAADAEHPNGALAIDHVVVATPSLERTRDAFGAGGVECRRIREAQGGVRQGFFLLGDLLVEVVDGTGLPPEAPARFWGLTLVVEDIDRAAALLGERLGAVKDAVQPGRRIATVRPEASEGLPLALISPRG
jgi:hypothetical protein